MAGAKKKKPIGLTIQPDGTITLKSERDVALALEKFQQLKGELDRAKEEYGINDLEQATVAYKAAAQNYMIEHGLEHVQCDGFHGTLVRGGYGSQWIASDDEITEAMQAEAGRELFSLQAIIEKKFRSKITEQGSKARKVWLRITKRVLDPEKIDREVQAGTFTVDEISPAWIEKQRKPYLRIFSDVK